MTCIFTSKTPIYPPIEGIALGDGTVIDGMTTDGTALGDGTVIDGITTDGTALGDGTVIDGITIDGGAAIAGF